MISAFGFGWWTFFFSGMKEVNGTPLMCKIRLRLQPETTKATYWRIFTGHHYKIRITVVFVELIKEFRLFKKKKKKKNQIHWIFLALSFHVTKTKVKKGKILQEIPILHRCGYTYTNTWNTVHPFDKWLNNLISSSEYVAKHERYSLTRMGSPPSKKIKNRRINKIQQHSTIRLVVLFS